MTPVRHTSDRPTAAATKRPSVMRLVMLALPLLLLRVPLLDHPTPVDMDERNLQAALGFPAQYPVQHPGYPLWVAMGTGLHAAGLGPYAAYQAWSLLASVAGPILLYLGLRWVLDDSLAWWLAIGFGVNPLVWFQGTTALSYMSGGTVGLIVVGLSYRALATRRAATMYWAAVILAVGVSLRMDLLIYLGPMLTYVAWRFRWGRGLGAMLVVAAGFGALLTVSSYLYGRADPTQARPELAHTFDVVFGTSVFRCGFVDGLLRNLAKMGVNLGWDFGVGSLLLPPAVWLAVRRRRDGPAERTAVLLLWTVPIAGFLALMHVVQGYFMLLLPAGYCVIGLALQSRFKPRPAACVAAAIAVCSTVQFLAYPWSTQSTGFKRLLDAKIAFQSASGLRQIDRRKDIHTPGDYWRTPAYQE